MTPSSTKYANGGFVQEEDLVKLQLIKKLLFSYTGGPCKKNAVYHLGEIGDDAETKNYSALQKREHAKMQANFEKDVAKAEAESL